jgi:hypothetical protein
MSELFKTGIVVSRGNSTTTPLGANGMFVGATEDVTSYEEIDINVAGSPYNAPGSLYFEFSPDTIHWDVSILVGGVQYSGPNLVPQHLRVVLPYFRVRYINGTTPQTQLRLTTVYHRASGTRLTRYLNQRVDSTEGTQMSRSFISGERPDGYYDNIQINTDNILLVDGSNVIQPISGFVTADQGIPASLADGWPVTITDGSSSVGITDISGVKALKVDVVKTVSSGGVGTGGTSSNFGDPFPIAGTAAGYSDGYSMRDAMVYNLAASLGTEYVLGTNLRTYADGYSVEAGTLLHPLRIDPTGTTVQPISGSITVSSGTITVTQGTNPWTVNGTVTANIGTTGGLGLDSSLTTIDTDIKATQPRDITDRAGRLLGVIYGSQGQQLKQTATNFNTQVEIAVGSTLIDPRSIRALTSADVVTANAGTGNFTVVQSTAANLNATVVGTTAAGFGASTGLVTIQGNAGGTPVPVTGIITTDIDGYVTAAAPTYINGTFNPVSLTTAGAVRVDGSGVTQPVSGTVTANAGTGNFTVVQATAANLNATVTQGTSPWVENVSQFGGNNVVTGTGASGAGIPRVTVSNDSNVLATQSGSWTVTANAGTGTFTVGGTVTANQGTPNSLANGWPVEITDGTNVLGTSSHPVRIDPTGTTTQPVSGTVTSNIGTTGGLALDTSVNGILVAQGSTTSGESGPLIQGAVTTAAPTYTTGKTNPLSLTTAGALRIDGSGTTQPISGTITSNQGTSPWVENVSQFGGNNVVTGTGASGIGIPRVTVANDSNILATQSGTWTVAQGAPNTLANKWPVQVTDGTNVMPTADVASRAQFDKITDGTNTAAVKAASTPAAATDPALVVAVSPNNSIATTSGTQTSNIDAGNSSTTPLSGNATFTGTGIDVSGYGVITVFVFADQAGTLNLEFSIDNSNWDDILPYSIYASTSEHIQIGPQARFFRIVYTNGSSAQSVFRLQTIDRPIISFNSMVPVDATTNSSVSASVTNVTLLSANVGRLGATCYNDSAQYTLYLKLGVTASTSSYSVQMIPGAYFEVPYGYTGQIDGIWSGAVGNARITELS